jgi:hypothetical protein
MVKINDDFVAERNLPGNIGLVLRGPYEKTIQLTKTMESCEMMYDVLINGSVYELIPAVYCSKLRR